MFSHETLKHTLSLTPAQVCNLSWSKNVNEVVSTHGYSQNQIIVWKQPSMTKLATLTGHTMRVLYLAVSPDGQTIVTGAGERPLALTICALVSVAGGAVLQQVRFLDGL